MMDALDIKKFSTIKTQKCTDQQCPIFNLFSNQIRARYYQLVYASDQFNFNCFGYHSDADKRRKVLQIVNFAEEIAYKAQYMIDIAMSNKKNAQSDKLKSKNITQTEKVQYFQDRCQNFIEYLYHPFIYKTISCPLVSKSKSPDEHCCNYKFCPYLHENQQLNIDLKERLNLYRLKNCQSQNTSSPKYQKQKQILQDKILKIILLRSSSSIQDLQKRQKRLIQCCNPNSAGYTGQQKDQNIPKGQSSISVQDRKQIQRIKSKLNLKASQCFKIDRQRQRQQQSRKVIKKNSTGGSKEQSNVTTKGNKQNMSLEGQITSYNYFKYGQRLPLLEGRAIEFKHFKDISDPHHIPLIMKYICAFLNTKGGKLYIGIDDNSYAYGAKFKQYQYDRLLLNIDKEGKFSMSPPLLPQKYQIKLIPVYQDKKDQQRWVIQINVFPPSTQNKKLFLFHRQCYMRMNASTHKLNASDLIQFFSINPSSQLPQNEDVGSIIQKVKFKQLNQLNKSLKNDQDLINGESNLSKRQNQLMKNNLVQKRESISTQKNKTEQPKATQFVDSLNKKSLQQLCSIKKDYESKLSIITEAYKKKQREMR